MLPMGGVPACPPGVIDPPMSWHMVVIMPSRIVEFLAPVRVASLWLAMLPLAACEPVAVDGGLPAECSADPVEALGFDFDAGDLLETETLTHYLDFAGSCVVDGMQAEDGVMITALSCDDAGMTRPVSISTPLEIAGEPQWAVDETLSVELLDIQDEVGSPFRSLVVRDGDAGLLFVGVERETLQAADIAPLTVEVDETLCAGPDTDLNEGETVRVALTFSLDGESIRLVDGQVGELTGKDGTRYSIHVRESVVGNFGEEGGWNRLIIQRTQ